MKPSVQKETLKAPYPSGVINKVLPKQGPRGALFISGLEGATNTNQLNACQIGAVLTCGSDISDTRFPNTIVHKIILILDYPDQDISVHFEDAIEYIDNELNSGKNVLVHCYVGVSRSVSIVLAYLMKKTGISLNAGYQYMKSIRPQIKPNEGFLMQLYQYYKTLSKKDVKIGHQKSQLSQVPTNIETNQQSIRKYSDQLQQNTLKIKPISGNAFNGFKKPFFIVKTPSIAQEN